MDFFKKYYINFLKQENFKAQNQIIAAINVLNKEKNTPFEVAKYLCNYVFNEFKYIKGVTTIETTVDEIWKLKSGVCQDFAHILLVMLRYTGIPSRYVSGYICPNKTGMRGEGATHAWVEAYLPDYGWLGLDPTNNCIVDDTHVRLAVGRNFVDCSPVKGTYKGTSSHKLVVKVIVSYEDDPTPKLEENTSNFSADETPINSYKKFIEMQQQQQQQ
jgi:transglutaminase-like putative cysteine protease